MENKYTEVLNDFVNCMRDNNGNVKLGYGDSRYLIAKLLIEVVDINVERKVNHIERKCNVNVL